MKHKAKLSNVDQKLKIVAVTKGKTVEEIQTMLRKTKLKRIAENRLEEAEEKFHLLPKKLEKHFIGKLQARKIKKIVKLFDVIQTIENVRQAKKIAMQRKKIKVMIEVNISGLAQRAGAQPKTVLELIKQIKTLPTLKLIGVMGIASPKLNRAQKEFRLLKSLQGDLSECSMGMSNDYKIALKEGSSMLRLGRALFQDRLPKLPKFE